MAVTVTDQFAASVFTPAQFDRSQSRADVEGLLGEEGVAIPRTDDMFEGLEPYAIDLPVSGHLYVESGVFELAMAGDAEELTVSFLR